MGLEQWWPQDRESLDTNQGLMSPEVSALDLFGEVLINEYTTDIDSQT